MSESAAASLAEKKETEIDDRANGMIMFPVAMSVKASDGEVQSAMQLVEEPESLRISEKLIARERQLRRSGLGSLLRVACANWMAHVARVISDRVACMFFPLTAGVV